MADRTASVDVAASRGPGLREFVALVAAMMASNALAIDMMLPALPAIGETLGVIEDNRRQLVITAYLLGFGVAQLIYGPLSDRFGRKGLLVASLALYGLFALLGGLASSFSLLLAARLLQGVSAAATRVLVISVIRDRYHGSGMARIMSIAMIVFMIVPLLAPTLGQGVLAIGSWRFIFLFLCTYGVSLAAWILFRLPETLPHTARRPLSPRAIGDAVWTTVRNRQSIGNTIALTISLGGLFGFLNSIQQIVFDVYGRPELIGLVFACISAPMALSSYVNSRLVMRFGSRRLLLIALSAFTAVALAHLVAASAFRENVWMFVAMQAATMSFFGLIGANAGALAMEPLGHIAGTASSVQGVISTTGGALIGFLIGQHFDGTTFPFLVGFASSGAAALAVVLWANRQPCRDTHDPVEIEIQETATRPG